MTAIGVVVMALVIGLSVWAIAVNSRPHSTRGDRGDGGGGDGGGGGGGD